MQKGNTDNNDLSTSEMDDKPEIRKYDEKLLEELVRDFPKEILGEPLSLYFQQPSLGGFKPDLVFVDDKGSFVIVELQLKALDRNHFYRSLEYRDLLMRELSCSTPRVILIANEINDKYRDLASIHNVECVILSKDVVLNHLNVLRPNIKLFEQESHAEKTSNKTLLECLLMLEKLKEEKSVASRPDAILMVVPGDFGNGDGGRSIEETNLFRFMPELEEQWLWFDSYRNDKEYFAFNENLDEQGFLTVSDIPIELVVSKDSFAGMSVEQERRIRCWLGIITKDHVWDNETQECVIGHRSYYNDPYNYEFHVQGRVRLFTPLWNHYLDYGKVYIQRIREDMVALQGIHLYAGKYPNWEPIPICKAIDVKPGSGPLKENLERNRKQFINLLGSGTSKCEEYLQKVDSLASCDDENWATVTFTNIHSDVLKIVATLFARMERTLLKNETLKERLAIRPILIPNQELKNVSEHRLLLGAKHFRHVEPQKIIEFDQNLSPDFCA